MELHPISFNDHKPLLLMCAGKADSPIKGLGLLRISHGDARNDCMKDWLARWCGCHVVLFLSYPEKDKGELLHADSDDAAHPFRDDGVHYSEMMPPTSWSSLAG